MNAIADSIEAEVNEEFVVQRHSPLWRNPDDGAMLYIYGTRRFPGDYRLTGYREDVYEVAVELVEPASQDDLRREESEELDFQERVDALVSWTDSHQTLAPAHRLDFVSLSYQDDLRRELMVRYARITLHARRDEEYA